MRRNIMAAIFSLAALCLFAPTTVAKAADTTTTISDDNGTYTVTIPTEVSIAANDTSATLEVSAELASYNELGISIESDNKFQLKCGDNYGLKYTLSDSSNNSTTKVDKITYSTKEGSKKTFSTTLKATLENSASAQVSGTYSDTLRFTMSCQESYPDGKAGLTFDANGGTVAADKKVKVLEIGDEYGELPTPTRTGYTFDGWYTATVNGEKVTEKDKLTKNTTVYAHWTANQYTVTYDINYTGNQISGPMTPSNMTYDSKQKLKKVSYNIPDKIHFAGWDTKADGTGTRYEDEAEVSNLVSEPNSTITLYAQWEYDNTVIVEFEDVNGHFQDEDKKTITTQLPANKQFTWDYTDLQEYKENAESWNHQWKTANDYEKIDYTTAAEPKETTIKIYRQWYYLDLNSQWYDSNGTGKGGSGNLKWDDKIPTAHVKVEINDEEQSGYMEATDYFVMQRYGSTFKFTITMLEGYEFIGIPDRSDQLLSDVQVNGYVVTGIVTGERHVQNDKGDEYWATTVALKIKKTSSDSTTTSTEEQSLDETRTNSDFPIANQAIMQKEESEIKTESVTESEESSKIESVPKTQGTIISDSR